MNASIILQFLIIGVCVIAAAAYALRNVTPALFSWLRLLTANVLERSGRTQAAARLRPSAKTAEGCATDDSNACGACGSCGSSKDAPPKEHVKEHAVVFHQGRR